MTAQMLLYRPTGLRELELVARAGWRVWPPRLPDQPIFYPVLTFSYAEKIARDWNTVDAFSGYCGFVTRFQVDDEFATRYPVQVAGGRSHEELWVPSEELETLNAHIRGFIEVVVVHVGPKSQVVIDADTGLPSGLLPPVVVADGPKYSCPCCRCFTLMGRGGYEVCPVCYWEDDGQDDHDADVVRGGPNADLSLVSARQNFTREGAVSPEFKDSVRAALPSERHVARRTSKTIGLRELIEAYVESLTPQVHPIMTDHMRKTVAAFETALGIAIPRSLDVVVDEDQMVFILFGATVESVMSNHSPLSGMLEGGLLRRRLDEAGDLGQGVMERWGEASEGVSELRLPAIFEIYTACPACERWVDLTGYCADGVWTECVSGCHLSSGPAVPAYSVAPDWRLCSKCTDAWACNDATIRAGCPSCGALTRLEPM